MKYNQKLFISKELLENLYIHKGLSRSKIAKLFNVHKDTVRYWLIKYNIPRQKSGKKERIKISKEELEELYWKKKLSTAEIARMYNCDDETIRGKMIKYNIPRRTCSEALKLKNPMFRPEVKMKHLERIRSKEVREKISKTMKNRLKNKIIREKHIKTLLKNLSKKPNKTEKKVLEVSKENNLPFEYVGDGKVIIGGRIPDFISIDNSKKVIEVFGTAFHKPEKSFFKIPYEKTEEGTKEHYKKYGFDCLIIWDTDIYENEHYHKLKNNWKDIIKIKIVKFLSSGLDILD